MIFNRAKTALVSCHPNHPLAFTSLNIFNNCFTFSTLKDKAERYLCSAVTYQTLYQIDLQTAYSLQKLKSNNSSRKNFSNQAYKLSQESFSLRERVIHNLNSLKLSSENNREEVRKIFEIGKGLLLRQKTQDTLEVKLVFNPIILFRQLVDQIANNRYLRKFLIGKQGIGKSSNQLLLSHLTTMLYLFRKQGKEAEVELQTLLKNNEQILRQILRFNQTKVCIMQNKQTTFVQIVKQIFYDIPLIYFYALPQKPQWSNILGLKRADFLRYFTEEQLIRFGINNLPEGMSKQEIKKINLQNACIFLSRLQESCHFNRIRYLVVIDHINLFYKLIPQKQQREVYLLFEKNKTREQLSTDSCYYNMREQLEIYSLIMNRIHSVFTNSTYIILTASASLSQNQSYQRRVGGYRCHEYARRFFNKQVSFVQRHLSYSKLSDSELWQKQIDITFIFQLEKRIHRLTTQIDSKTQHTLPSNYKQKISSVVRQLKYRYYEGMDRKQSKKESWSHLANHQLIRQNVESIEALMIIQKMFKSIIDFLVESGKLRSEQQVEGLKQNLSNNLLQKMKGLKQIIKQKIM